MVSNINNIQQSNFQPEMFQRQSLAKDKLEPLNSFTEEDQAIISSQAKLLSELDKFNSGGDNLVDLALANIMSKITIEAEVNVIQTKKDMMNDILDIGKLN